MEQCEIRADYDQHSIVVYQAYSRQIALPALKAQRFVPPFSLHRATWIKPSYLWLMHRSGWGRKAGQEYILAVRISRKGWEEALSCAVLTSYHKGVHRDGDEWREQFEQAHVHVQWDPERTLRGKEGQTQSIQVGLTRSIIETYVDEWVVEIKDYTPLTQKIYRLLQTGETAKAKAFLPKERVYPLAPAIKKQLGMSYER